MNEPILPGCEPFVLGDGPIGIVMVHGFTGSPASMRPMGEWFADQGLSVAGVRLPGHGTSVEDLRERSWTEWVDAAADALAAMRERCRTVVLLGQSMGGAIAIHLAASHPGALDGLVLCSPYVFDIRLIALPVGRRFLKQVKGIANDIAKPGQDERAYDVLPVEGLSTMFRLLRHARVELPKVRTPALVFEPRADHAIPSSNPRKVHAALGSTRKELIRCPRSYHVITLDHDAEMVRERALAFARELDAAKAG